MKTVAAFALGIAITAASASVLYLYILAGLTSGYELKDLSDIGGATQAITAVASLLGVFALIYTIYYQAKSIRQINRTIGNQVISLGQQQLTVNIMAAESALRIYRIQLVELEQSKPFDATAKAQYLKSRDAVEKKIRDLEQYCENLFLEIGEISNVRKYNQQSKNKGNESIGDSKNN